MAHDADFSTRRALNMLRAADGAILAWQIPSAFWCDFECARANGVIRFDVDSDCFVHPDARALRDDVGEHQGYTMGGNNA